MFNSYPSTLPAPSVGARQGLRNNTLTGIPTASGNSGRPTYRQVREPFARSSVVSFEYNAEEYRIFKQFYEDINLGLKVFILNIAGTSYLGRIEGGRISVNMVSNDCQYVRVRFKFNSYYDVEDRIRASSEFSIDLGDLTRCVRVFRNAVANTFRRVGDS